jgi:hypothetical protein
MRFRAKLRHDNDLLPVLEALGKLAPKCLLVLSPANTHIKVISEWTSGESAFVKMRTTRVFESARVESIDSNEIGLEVNISMLSQALTTSKNVESTTVRLRLMDERPVLSFSADSGNKRATQSVPVQILLKDRLAGFEEPEVGQPQINLRMPDLRSFAPVVDRMRHINENEVRLVASTDGELQVEVASDMLKLSTLYRPLEVLSVGERAVEPGAEPLTASAVLSTRKLCNVLHVRCVLSDKVVLCISEERAVVVHLVLPHGPREDPDNITYYVPVLHEELPGPPLGMRGAAV